MLRTANPDSPETRSRSRPNFFLTKNSKNWLFCKKFKNFLYKRSMFLLEPQWRTSKLKEKPPEIFILYVSIFFSFLRRPFPELQVTQLNPDRQQCQNSKCKMFLSFQNFYFNAQNKTANEIKKNSPNAKILKVSQNILRWAKLCLRSYCSNHPPPPPSAWRQWMYAIDSWGGGGGDGSKSLKGP